jgi:hypothetical protein
MKIRPVQTYPAPGYPTREQARQDPDLLKNVPARWEKAPGFAALLGLLALTSSGAEAAEDGAPPPAAALDPEGGGERGTAADVQRAGAIVAPILDEALERDGRGAFGCVAISPPSFLSEDEALELIRTELEAAGLRLRDDAVLEDMTAPTGPAESRKEVKGPDGETVIQVNPGWGQPNVLGQRPVRFDWADPDRAVYIDYLTRPIEGLPPEQARRVDAEYRRAAAEAQDSRGRDKLRRQVRHFVEFLKQEGVLPPPQ